MAEPEYDGITVEQLVAELDRVLQEQEAEGLTVREIAKGLGLGPERARERVRAAVQSGRWQCSGRAQRLDMRGQTYFAPVYGPVKKEKQDGYGND